MKFYDAGKGPKEMTTINILKKSDEFILGICGCDEGEEIENRDENGNLRNMKKTLDIVGT